MSANDWPTTPVTLDEFTDQIEDFISNTASKQNLEKKPPLLILKKMLGMHSL
jgi:hypothetical protein